MRAPTDLALPDPVLIEAENCFEGNQSILANCLNLYSKLMKLKGKEKSTREIVGLRLKESEWDWCRGQFSQILVSNCSRQFLSAIEDAVDATGRAFE